jgi:hypothetical protein
VRWLSRDFGRCQGDNPAVSTDTPDGSVVRRKEARSGIEYADPITVYKTRDTIILFRPWYIPHHTNPTGLAGKLEKWKCKNGFRVGLHPELELSLDEEASQKLLEALQLHSAVAAGGSAGEYAVIKLDEGASVGRDPAALARAFASVLTDEAVAKHLIDEDLAPSLVSTLRGSLRIRELKLAVQELREMLDTGVVHEKHYQDWCEAHSWAFGLGYVERDDFRRISAGDDIDLLLPQIISGYRDVAELKRPDHPVLRYDQSHKSYYWSIDTSSAIGQVTRYLDVLHEEARKGLRDRPEVVAWYPRAVIVIGRTTEWNEDVHRGLWALNSRLHAIEVTTYDHLLARGERLLEILLGEPA